MADDAPSNPLTQLLGRFGLPADQLASLQGQLSRAFLPTEQLQTMRDLMATFSPSLDQLDGIRAQLDAQKSQLESMLAQLEEMETTLERLSGTAEQVLAMQEPFQRLTRLFGFPVDAERSSRRTAAAPPAEPENAPHDGPADPAV